MEVSICDSFCMHESIPGGPAGETRHTPRARRNHRWCNMGGDFGIELLKITVIINIKLN